MKNFMNIQTQNKQIQIQAQSPIANFKNMAEINYEEYMKS